MLTTPSELDYLLFALLVPMRGLITTVAYQQTALSLPIWQAGLAVQIRSFRSGLRHMKTSGDEDAITGHLSYALLFGLASGDRLPHARFAASWIRACASLPGWMPAEVKRPRLGDPDGDQRRGQG